MKKFKRGKHEYIFWDKKSKQVRTLAKKKTKKTEPAGAKILLDETSKKTSGVFAENFLIHFNENEFIIDFLQNVSPGRFKISSRAILTPKTAKKLSKMIQLIDDGQIKR